MSLLDFSMKKALAYRKIIETAGFSRRKVIDRMIAATAVARDLTLVTRNGRDFRDIAGLQIETW